MFPSKCILLCVIFLFVACATKNNKHVTKMETHNKTPDEKGETENSVILSAPIVEKQRVIKNEAQAETDFFLERSVQDYFIKFCESAVSREMLENYLKKQRSTLKILHAEIEYREGEWDNCQSGEKVASRTGAYIVIHRIID